MIRQSSNVQNKTELLKVDTWTKIYIKYIAFKYQ
jgi:hypothetical protein